MQSGSLPLMTWEIDVLNIWLFSENLGQHGSNSNSQSHFFPLPLSLSSHVQEALHSSQEANNMIDQMNLPSVPVCSAVQQPLKDKVDEETTDTKLDVLSLQSTLPPF